MPQSTALEKLLKGETLTEEENKAITPEELESLTDEQIDALPPSVKKKVDEKIMSSINGRREELRRLGEKKNDHKEEDNNFSKKMVEENTARAEAMAFAELANRGIELTEETKSAIREKRKKISNGAVTVDNIVDEFLEAAAAVNSKTLFGAHDKARDMERAAAQFNAGGAGGSGGGIPSEEDRKKYSKEVLDWVAASEAKGVHITPEQAKKVIEGGLNRVYK